MKRINSLVCTAAIMLILGTAVSYAQYGSGRALLAYPMNGQTLEQENADRVMMMTFSEFGRRVEQNASGGTDHGAAAPMFVFGEKIKAGDPSDRATVVGPMINSDALAKIQTKIEDAVSAGARVVCGGGVTGNCLEATVIENAPPTCDLCADEAFAPIVTLHRYREFEEALAFVNESRFGLQAGVFTRDLQLAMRAYSVLDVGGVMVNQVPTFRVENMPYGGVKDSGFGREGVRYAMEEMTELKSFVMKLG